LCNHQSPFQHRLKMKNENLSSSRHSFVFSFIVCILLSAEVILIKAEDEQIDELEECLRDFDTEIVGLGGISLLGTMDSVS
jgi:hypothetical protein